MQGCYHVRYHLSYKMLYYFYIFFIYSCRFHNYISQVLHHWIWGIITERFIIDGYIVRKLNLDDILEVLVLYIIWRSKLDGLTWRWRCACMFYCLCVSSYSQPYHRLRPCRLCPRIWWIFGTTKSTDISGPVMLYILRRDLSLFESTPW